MGSVCFGTGRFAGNVGMADISLEEFEQRIIAACGASPIVESISVADNAGGWHWHPVDDVARHVSSDHEITFEEFFREVGKRVE